MSSVRFYSRGLHHRSIFTYDVDSHKIMNEIINVFLNVAEFVIYRSCVFQSYLIRTDEENHDMVLEVLGELQDIAIANFLRVFERFRKKYENEKFEFRVFDVCEEYDFCEVEVNLMLKNKNQEVLQVLTANLILDLVEIEEGIGIDLTFKTAIHVPEKTIPLNEIEKMLQMLPIPCDPEKEIITEVQTSKV